MAVEECTVSEPLPWNYAADLPGQSHVRTEKVFLGVELHLNRLF